MILKQFKIIVICASFIFLNGFLPIFSLIGPGLTIATTGSAQRAGVQYMVSHNIKKETGKNSLSFLKEKLSDKKKNIKNFNKKLEEIVNRRVALAQKKLNFTNN
tara:strand:- start:204 stop:515 length:312 start_codon:yes stop_codon:yes gene_type:complete